MRKLYKNWTWVLTLVPLWDFLSWKMEIWFTFSPGSKFIADSITKTEEGKPHPIFFLLYLRLWLILHSNREEIEEKQLLDYNMHKLVRDFLWRNWQKSIPYCVQSLLRYPMDCVSVSLYIYLCDTKFRESSRLWIALTSCWNPTWFNEHDFILEVMVRWFRCKMRERERERACGMFWRWCHENVGNFVWIIELDLRLVCLHL